MTERIQGAALYAGIAMGTVILSRVFMPAFLMLLLLVLFFASREMKHLSSAGSATGYLWQMRTQGLTLLIPLFFSYGREAVGKGIFYPTDAMLIEKEPLRALLLFLLWQFCLALVFSFYRLSREGSEALTSCYVASAQAFALSLGLFSAAMILYAIPYGWFFLLIAILTPWVSDSAAWFVGRNWGKRQAFPRLSPKKTVAGVLGALFFTALFYFLISLFINTFGHMSEQPAIFWILAGVVASVLAQAGDLWASALKRRVGVKDSGQLIPGHGGIIDRIDSSLTLFPVFFLCLLLVR